MRPPLSLWRRFQQRSHATRLFATSHPSPLERALVAGGDDRSALHGAQHRNKYNVSPWPLPTSALFRGSCTCNPPTPRGYEAASAMHHKLIAGSTSYSETMATIRRRLAHAFELSDTAVILCPSGSDAEYIPLALAQALDSEARLGNIVTQFKEIGAGSAPAANLEYFSTSTPLGSRSVTIGDSLAPQLSVETVTVPARDDDGTPINAAGPVGAHMSDFFGRSDDGSALLLVHSVYGGKTGLRDSVVQTDLSKGIVGVVDACQGRFTNAELKSWLDSGCIVLITGSKFYRGPPFSGAVLVPNSLIPKSGIPPLVSKLLEFVCPDDLPDQLAHWRPALPAQQNVGLALRWEAALADIEASAPYSVEIAEQWAQQVATMLPGDTLECFESRRCILSLRIRPSPHQPWFDVPELRKIYDWMTLDVSPVLPDAPAANVLCSIGQPVQVANGSGVLRLALGVDSLDQFTKHPQTALDTDNLIIQKLHHLASNFDLLLQHQDKLKPPSSD